MVGSAKQHSARELVPDLPQTKNISRATDMGRALSQDSILKTKGDTRGTRKNGPEQIPVSSVG